MSERFGVPDHAPQHAPDHAQQNPTSSTPYANIGGGGWAPSAYSTPVYTGGGSGPVWTGPYVRPKRSLAIGIVLATILGPFGLFYVNILSGIAALFILPPVVRTLAAMYAISTHGGIAAVYRVAIPILWCITIPWAIIGIKIRNVRVDRSANRMKAEAT
jgi:hypothetical protein